MNRSSLLPDIKSTILQLSTLTVMSINTTQQGHIAEVFRFKNKHTKGLNGLGPESGHARPVRFTDSCDHTVAVNSEEDEDI
ncbi:hypothetical protein VNO77_02263 [Canavalia gladiata]|uniref:Uncharacterized protein n=1 Tax=Canavalia gladiata TaxID=3824 RepID=A0AAN9MSN2_CANGL